MFSEALKKHKMIILIVGVAIIGLVALVIYIAATRIGKEPVVVSLLPADTILTANGERLHVGTAYLNPGKYTLEASRGGFKSQTKVIDIVSPNTLEIDIALDPESKEAAQWVRENEKLYLEYEGRIGLRKNEEGETFSALNPITSDIPYKNLLYTIGYKADNSDPTGNSIILQVNAAPGYRNAAVNKIRELGYDPTDFKINFTNYESPFDHE